VEGFVHFNLYFFFAFFRSSLSFFPRFDTIFWSTQTTSQPPLFPLMAGVPFVLFTVVVVVLGKAGTEQRGRVRGDDDGLHWATD
jgi:hypothetical protein